MSKKIKLSLSERYYIKQYLLSLPCTLNYRVTVDEVLEQLSITNEEVEKSNIKIDVLKNELTVKKEIQKEIDINEGVLKHVTFLYQNIDPNTKAYEYLGILVK